MGGDGEAGRESTMGGQKRGPEVRSLWPEPWASSILRPSCRSDRNAPEVSNDHKRGTATNKRTTYVPRATCVADLGRSAVPVSSRAAILERTHVRPNHVSVPPPVQSARSGTCFSYPMSAMGHHPRTQPVLLLAVDGQCAQCCRRPDGGESCLPCLHGGAGFRARSLEWPWLWRGRS